MHPGSVQKIPVSQPFLPLRGEVFEFLEIAAITSQDIDSILAQKVSASAKGTIKLAPGHSLNHARFCGQFFVPGLEGNEGGQMVSIGNVLYGRDVTVNQWAELHHEGRPWILQRDLNEQLQMRT